MHLKYHAFKEETEKFRKLASNIIFLHSSQQILMEHKFIHRGTDYGRPERKQPSLHGQKFNPNPKFLGTAEAYFVCHIG